MNQTRDQKRFTISEVAADWHELMIPQRTMRPSIARVNWTRGLQLADIPPPQSATPGLHPVARKLLLISRPYLNHTQLALVVLCFRKFRLQSCIIKQTTV